MAKNSSQHTNALINESSPYLLEHVNNPVNWHPWGQEALDKAKEENKLIIISIGYAACHWCHVMMHESFEDVAVARVMNEHYIAIKVDREERPDIDQIYMNAIQLLTGSGGWPLNAIALPDGRPIYGGTYFRKEKWIEVLTNVAAYAKEHPEKTEEVAGSLTEGVRASELISVNAEVQPVTMDDLNAIYRNWKRSFDLTNGGYNGAPKFPLPIGYQFLLMYHYLTGDSSAITAVITTLDNMANGGIYDQIGGGFARYSVDAYWQVPHFEKMLYDNSQLVNLYAAAYQSTKQSNYKDIVYETLGFVERELTSEEGGFYSSLDADSEGEEGTFYVWTKEAATKVLGNDAAIINDYYSITENGNWEEGKNTLFKLTTDEELADKHNITVADLLKKVDAAKKILLEERSKRIYPRTDDKIIAGWNALMLKAYADAYKVMGDEKFLNAAIRNAGFILDKMRTVEGSLFRSYKNRKASVNAFLDDYALTIDAFITLYQVTFDEKWLKEAHRLTEYALLHFFDTESGMFFYTSDMDAALIARKMEVTDNVVPSSNSVMAKNLFMVGSYFSKNDYVSKAEKMVANVKEQAIGGGPYYANWDILMAWFESQPYEVGIVGDNYNILLKEFNQHYLPNVFFYGGDGKNASSLIEDKFVAGQTTIYVCRNKVCKLPVTTLEDALIQLQLK